MTLPLRVRDLSHSFGAQTVLCGIDFTAEAGKVTALLGPNGAGKSTLISCATGLHRPTAGSIEVLGAPAGTSAEQRAAVGVMLQSGGLPLAATPRSFLRHIARLYRNPRSPEDLIESLDMIGYQNRGLRRLSGGQRQRVAFAAAVIGRPAVAFLDEPSAGMDTHGRDIMHHYIRTLRDEGTAVVLTSHNMAEVEILADCVYVLSQGRIVTRGTPEQLVESLGLRRTVLWLTDQHREDAAQLITHKWPTAEVSGSTVRLPYYLDAKEIASLAESIIEAGSDIERLTMQRASLEEAVEAAVTNGFTGAAP